ncbi:radical SAM protein [Patescibacteria group bacterium]|nr:radical SAM protein [Patescibacteria group bacterium]
MKQLLLKGSAPHLNKEQKLGLKKIDYIMLNLPFECDYNCIKCCNKRRKYKKGYLELKKIKNYILKCKNLGARVLVLAGEGEPLINKNFKELIFFANKIKLIPYIFTNGSMLNKELALFLAQNNATLIINLDSFEEDKYDKYVNKKGAFKNLIKNIKTAREVYKNKVYSFNNYRITYLAINLVLNNENYNQIKKIKKFCKDDVLFVVNKPINIGSASEFWKKYNNVKDITINEDVSFPLGTLSKDEQCAYMRNGVSIGADGSILTCAYALETQNLYGNIDDDIILIKQKVLKSIDEFYQKYGASRCILRHPDYKIFLKNG